jgi:hypothetical protein
MGDAGRFSDDISALWGADDAGVLNPAPLRPPDRVDDADGTADDRVDALEAHLHAVTEQVQSLREELLALDHRVARLDELRAELARNASQADDERRQLEASWQQPMPGL